MGAYSHSNGSVEETTSSARSFFSRFALPIRSRTRNLADFHVRPDDPHRQYSAGDHVRGAVVLTVVKPVRITHLTVTLHGYVRVHKGPAVSEPPVANPALSGRTSAQYHGNGYASLFQDEQVLSGEGRLEASKYEFNFDLVFPEKGLPSSIDFERGTISYMITATLTRPTSISPTTSCDRKIQLVEKVDIGPLAPPRPRTIYLEPISKKSKRKKTSGEKNSLAVDTIDYGNGSDMEQREAITPDPAASNDESTHDPLEQPRSPTHTDIQSEVSGDSTISSSTGISLTRAEPRLGSTSLTNSKMQAVDEKTITATIEMLRGGALPGDTVSVKVSVQHIKRIKSMHGVIVTMYRQGRVDTAPPASMFADIMTKEETRKLAKEDYYPRSRTGLGGLSLSSTSSLSVFRKDLSQSVAPLIIDPVTLETTVTASVKVPEDVFPTIKGVPGEMVSFKYQVEVLVDLGGRLASQLQGGGQSRVAQFAPGSGAPDSNTGLSAWGGNVIDTDRLRREKGVISVVFEVILGTTDSTRLRGRSNTVRTYQLHEESLSREDVSSPWPVDDIYAEEGEGNWPLGTPQSTGALGRRPTITIQPTSPPEEEVQAPAYIPPPEVTDEARLTDKERARRQEERLLPSQPPQTAEAGPSGPSAPPGPNIYDADDEPSPEPPTPQDQHREEDQPSAPTLNDLSTAREARTEDKQELERQRLLNEASSPPEFPDDYDAGPSASAPPADAAEAPSAPALTDEDEYGEQYSYRTEGGAGQPSHASGSEPLPRYER